MGSPHPHVAYRPTQEQRERWRSALDVRRAESDRIGSWFGAEIRRERKLQDRTIRECAADAGMSCTRWGDAELGRCGAPTLRVLMRMSQTMGICPGDLVRDLAAHMNTEEVSDGAE